MLITKVLDPHRLNSTEIGLILYAQAHSQSTDGAFWEDLSQVDRRIYINHAQSILDVLVGLGILGVEGT